MKRKTLLIVICLLTLNAKAQLNLTYISNYSYTDPINDVWGYTATNGIEYVLVGTSNGTSIISLANSANPEEVAYITGDNSSRRDIKTWGDFAFVTTNEGDDGLTVINLSNLPNSVSSSNITNIPGVGTLATCSNIYIDEYGYAYLAGCNLNNGGILIYDCFTTPDNPQFVAMGLDEPTHDVYTRDNKMYASKNNFGTFTIFDVSDKNNITTLGSQTTPFAYTNSMWLSDNSSVLFVTDEAPNAPISAYDVTNPLDIQFLDSYVPLATLGNGVVPNNVQVKEDWLIVSYHTDGCIIIDASNPDNLVEVGNFDTYLQDPVGLSGAIGVYPFLPSGLILCSDIENGLYVLDPNYVRACYFQGNVTDASTGSSISSATVEIEDTFVFDNTNSTGEYKTGIAIPGFYQGTASCNGYQSQSFIITLVNGQTTIQNFNLEPLEPFELTGTIVQTNGTPIPAAKIHLFNDAGSFNYSFISDSLGNFTIPSIIEGNYHIESGKWGFKTKLINELLITAGNPLIIELENGYEAIFTLDLGWIVSGENFTGDWEVGTSIPQLIGGVPSITPIDDLPIDQGNSCYITQNGSDLFNNVLINGNTVLTSPIFDLSTYNEPTLSFYKWYLSVNISGYAPTPSDDIFVTTISNGSESVILSEDLFDGDFENIDWSWSGNINISDFIEPTDSMSISFEANAELGYDIITEAGIDYFQAWDAAPTSLNDLTQTKIQTSVFPNPTADTFTLVYDFSEINELLTVKVLNVVGQTVKTITLDKTTNKVRFGNDLDSGIYLVHIEAGGQAIKTVKLVKQ